MEEPKHDRVLERAGRESENYALRVIAGRAAGRNDGDLEQQVEHFAKAQAVLARLRADTGAVLDSLGVPYLVRPYYYAFAMKLARRDRELWSEAHRRREARVQVDLWAGRGLERGVLLAISRQVLGMDLSVPEPCAAGP